MFVVNTEDEMDGLSDAGVGFYRLLSYIADEYDVSQALMSMLSVSSVCGVISMLQTVIANCNHSCQSFAVV